MWDAVFEGISPHLIAGSVMVAIMGVMFTIHRIRGGRHRPPDPLEVLKLRFARGEIDRAEYEERRKILSGDPVSTEMGGQVG